MAPIPFDTMLPGERIIALPNARPFDAAQMLYRSPLRRRLAKSNPVYTHHPEPCDRVEGERSLPQELVRTRSSWLTCRIQPHAGFADPSNQSAGTSSKRHRAMRHPCPRLKHQARNASNRNVNPGAVCSDRDEGSVPDI